ncbi:MAG: YncE family protein, partial [Candidatus Methylomirabilaceae bacterium]
MTNFGAGTVSIIDTATNTVIPPLIPVGSLPQQVALKPDGTLAYVTNAGSGTVLVISTFSNT